MHALKYIVATSKYTSTCGEHIYSQYFKLSKGLLWRILTPSNTETIKSLNWNKIYLSQYCVNSVSCIIQRWTNKSKCIHLCTCKCITIHMCSTCVSLEFACYIMIQLYYVATQSLNIHTPATQWNSYPWIHNVHVHAYILYRWQEVQILEKPLPDQYLIRASLTHWHIHTYM